jgi:hypothetical protein
MAASPPVSVIDTCCEPNLSGTLIVVGIWFGVENETLSATDAVLKALLKDVAPLALFCQRAMADLYDATFWPRASFAARRM